MTTVIFNAASSLLVVWCVSLSSVFYISCWLDRCGWNYWSLTYIAREKSAISLWLKSETWMRFSFNFDETAFSSVKFWREHSLSRDLVVTLHDTFFNNEILVCSQLVVIELHFHPVSIFKAINICLFRTQKTHHNRLTSSTWCDYQACRSQLSPSWQLLL